MSGSPQRHTGDATLGNLLREIREELGLSLCDVAALTDGEFKVATLSSYERGERSLSVARLVRLTALYDVSVTGVLQRAYP
jgi:transcriptional regulator with XRE-family HTH domain